METNLTRSVNVEGRVRRIDADGLCDDIDDCVGIRRVWRLQRPGAIYQCGCTDILEGDCDCNGNQLDALGVCGGDCDADEDGRHLR